MIEHCQSPVTPATASLQPKRRRLSNYNPFRYNEHEPTLLVNSKRFPGALWHGLKFYIHSACTFGMYTDKE